VGEGRKESGRSQPVQLHRLTRGIDHLIAYTVLLGGVVMRCSVLLLILAFAGSLSLALRANSPVKSSAATLTLSPAEQAAWKGEETYWQFQKADDRDAFLALWDERFVGWPRRTSVPVDKDKMREDLKRAPDRKVLDYKLEPLSVREYGGNVVITLYRATVHSTDNNGNDGQTRPYRLTHTWMKTGQAWQIIGGMSSADNSN